MQQGGSASKWNDKTGKKNKKIFSKQLKFIINFLGRVSKKFAYVKKKQ